MKLNLHRFQSANRLLAAVVVAWLLAVTAGCEMLKQPPMAKQYFAIDAGPPDDQSATTAGKRPHGEILRVVQLRVSQPYDGVDFIYRIGPSQFDVDHYNNFIASPASLLTGSLISWLERSLPMRVVGASTSLQTDLSLEGNITALYIDSVVKPGRTAVIAGRFFLIRSRGGGDELVKEMHYRETARVEGQSPAGFSAAIGQAWRQLLAKLSQDLESSANGSGATQ